MNRFKFLFLALIVSFAMVPFAPMSHAETLQEQLNRLQKEIENVRNEKSSLQSQISKNNYSINGYSSEVSKLYGEAQVYQKELDELNLQITELEINIKILGEQITKTEDEIKKNEDEVDFLEKESNSRLKNSYYNFRMYGTIDNTSSLPFFGNINTYFKDSQYKEIIQSDTNDIITELNKLKEQLVVKKKELGAKLEQVKKDRELIVIKQEDVKKKNSDIEAKMAVFNQQIQALRNANNQTQGQVSDLNNSEKQLNAQYLLVLQQIMTTNVTSGTYIKAGTIIGFQGNTGYVIPLPSASNPTAGTHLHYIVYANGVAVNPCSYLQPGNGCGNGGPLQPPLRGNVIVTQWFTGAYAHNGVDFVSLPVYGQPVYASHDGILTRGVDCWHKNQGYPTNGCANYAKIKGDDGLITGYWHLK